MYNRRAHLRSLQLISSPLLPHVEGHVEGHVEEGHVEGSESTYFLSEMNRGNPQREQARAGKLQVRLMRVCVIGIAIMLTWNGNTFSCLKSIMFLVYKCSLFTKWTRCLLELAGSWLGN